MGIFGWRVLFLWAKRCQCHETPSHLIGKDEETEQIAHTQRVDTSCFYVTVIVHRAAHHKSQFAKSLFVRLPFISLASAAKHFLSLTAERQPITQRRSFSQPASARARVCGASMIGKITLYAFCSHCAGTGLLPACVCARDFPHFPCADDDGSDEWNEIWMYEETHSHLHKYILVCKWYCQMNIRLRRSISRNAENGQCGDGIVAVVVVDRRRRDSCESK